MRALYIAGWSYVAFATVVLYQTPREPAPTPTTSVEPLAPALIEQPTTTSWFDAVRARCNAVEVEVTISNHPPPSDWASQGYAAACYALAGKIERARDHIDALPSDERALAANIVFNVGHPVADAGDDDAAGPIMELVIQYTPDNYMALYHAGIAQAHLGEADLARKNLSRFLELYRENDGWTESARTTLAELGTR